VGSGAWCSLSQVATIRKALITPLRERYDVEFGDRSPGWHVQGNIVDHEYRIESDAGKVAEVGKKWFRVRDTYGVEVAADALVGEEGKGFRYILDGMNAERILIAAECIGDGRWFVQKAAAYASDRV